MITLHGSGGFELLDRLLDNQQLEPLLFNASKVLHVRKFPSAAELLNRIPFTVFKATNDFNDDFNVLYAMVPLNTYEELRQLSKEHEGRIAFDNIAAVITEIGPYIRFVACELSPEHPDVAWQDLFKSSRVDKHSAANRSGVGKKLPVAVCAVANEVLSGSHATLDALFQTAGAPGDPPKLSHPTKWKMWLSRASDDPNTDAHQVLGRILEEVMEVEPTGEDTCSVPWLGQDYPSAHSLWEAKKRRVEDVLGRYGLRYVRGGCIVEASSGIASEAMAEVLRDRSLDTVAVEFRRALQFLPDDPGAAITAGCALLEALFRAFIEANALELPSKLTIKPLWSIVQKELCLDPKDQSDLDVQRILTGMSSVVDGVGALRTHAGSAHGGGRLRYRVKPRHARLLINSAHTLALFVIQTWEDRQAKPQT